MTPETTLNEEIATALGASSTNGNVDSVNKALFDAEAVQTVELLVRDETGAEFNATHVFNALTEDRYLEFVTGVRIESDGDDAITDTTDATDSLWNDLILNVENTEVPEGENFRDLIDFAEKEAAIDGLIAVSATYSSESQTSKPGVRRLAKTFSVRTEAFFNGVPTTQTHVLRNKTLDDLKEYNAIRRRRFKREIVKGSRSKPTVKYFPQFRAFGKLYDAMIQSTEGFVNDIVPLRFKTAVIHFIFAPQIEDKNALEKK